MTGRVRTYRIVVPPPWERIALDTGAREQIEAIVDDVAARHTPAHVPPDQVGPRKREIVELMTRQAQEAADHGGVDLYVPLADIHGYSVQASFLVSESTPSATMESDEVPAVLTSLLGDQDTRPVTIDSTTWVRRERRVPADGDDLPASTRVEYVTAVPGSPRHWITVAFSSAGEPIVDPDDPDASDLLVALFDAIMTTWRWEYDTVDPAAAPTIGAEHG